VMPVVLHLEEPVGCRIESGMPTELPIHLKVAGCVPRASQ
jgi:hypothetical protein